MIKFFVGEYAAKKLTTLWAILTLAGALCVMLWSGCAVAQTPAAAKSECGGDYSGQWQTSFGSMVLAQDGDKVTGTYAYGTGATMDGTCEKGRLNFLYHEQPATVGEGWFELDASGGRFSGRWREKGKAAWGQWEGSKLGNVGGGRLAFDGLFDTSFGRLRLVRDGDDVRGEYLGPRRGLIKGKVEKDRLVFDWAEGADKGDGWFAMLPNNSGVDGQWRRAGEAWKPWQGTTVQPTPGVRWLVILETHWERSLVENEYAFGEMLRTYFERTPQVKVRHRRIFQRADLEATTRDLTFLAEPVVLLIAGHGDAGGLVIGDARLGSKELTPLLAAAPNVFLVHFSSCAIMAGDVATKIKAGLSSRRRLAVSGYASPVDWGASAVLEMFYLDLVLARGVSPATAAEIVREDMRFAGDDAGKNSPINALKFRIIE